MARPKFQGKTKAYGQFSSLLWRTRSLVDLGTVGIDRELQEKIDPILAKLAAVKGVRGRRPKNYKPTVKSTKADDGEYTMEMDLRSAHLVKQAMKLHRKRHDDLRYSHTQTLP